MRHTQVALSITFCVLGALALTACHHSASNPTTTGPGATGPMNEKERLFAEQWERVTRGLDLDNPSGLIEVEPVAAGTAAAAAAQLSTANELFAANRIVDSMEHYGLAARQDPGLAEAYVGMGLVLSRKGKHEQAIRSYRTALDRDGAHADARYRLAVALWTASRQEDAIFEMNRLLDADDTHAGAHERLAVWSYYTGAHEDAWRHLHRAEELGRPVPGQLAALLQQRMPDPGSDAD